MSATVIEAVRIIAAHEGTAELEIVLKFENGGRSPVALDEAAASALMDNCNVKDPQQLVGQSWEKVRDALTHSWNRYQNGSPRAN